MSDANTSIPTTGRQIRSLITADGTLELSLVEVEVPTPSDDQVLVRIEAAPINPSDLGLLFAGADMTAATASGTPGQPVVNAPIAPAVLAAMAGRVGESMAVGNEGGGVVVAAGSSPAAQALLGRTVGVLGGSMYSEYRCVHLSQCLPLPDRVTPEQGAACFVNPLTALGMVGTMRGEGHTALVHTAAASNLGQMLNRVCLADGIDLVNIVRRPEQEALLRDSGATHVCDSSSDTFLDDLTSALTETGATIAFDAIGGGNGASRILTAMERAANARATEYSRYGSTVHKQVYIYGGLDRGPTELTRNFGMSWGVGGWLLTPYMMSAGADEVARMRSRVAAEITTTFASGYTAREPGRSARTRRHRRVRQAGDRHEVPHHASCLSEHGRNRCRPERVDPAFRERAPRSGVLRRPGHAHEVQPVPDAARAGGPAANPDSRHGARDRAGRSAESASFGRARAGRGGVGHRRRLRDGLVVVEPTDHSLQAGLGAQAWGALLLFSANVTAILAVGVVTMALYRVRRFGFALAIPADRPMHRGQADLFIGLSLVLILAILAALPWCSTWTVRPVTSAVAPTERARRHDG